MIILFKLIKIELKKVLKHKSIYIVLLITLSFCLLNDIIYKNDYNKDGEYKYIKKEKITNTVSKLETKLKKYNLSIKSQQNIYIEYKTKLDIAKIKKEYHYNSWQYQKANTYLYKILYDLNYNKYITKDINYTSEVIKKHNNIYEKFKKNNWQYFVKEEKKILRKKIKDLNKDINNTKDISLRKKLIANKKPLNNQLKILNYRLKYNISNSNTYLNRALETYQEDITYINNYKEIKDYKDKLRYNELLSELNLNKYIFIHKSNQKKENSLNYQLRTIVDDYELFIIIIILIVSNILIGEEFSKGTIKLLLVKPYKRTKILLSKYLTGIIIFLGIITSIIIFQLIAGGILLDFNSLKDSIAIYNYNTKEIITINIFIYMLIRIMCKIPMLIVIQTICFVLEIILNSPPAAFSITMLIYTFSEVINKIAITYNIKAMQLLVSINWNFKDYLFGGLSPYKYISLKKSILIVLFYVIILLGIMFKTFEKKNIKNI